jgi:hypothetical protein
MPDAGEKLTGAICTSLWLRGRNFEGENLERKEETLSERVSSAEFYIIENRSVSLRQRTRLDRDISCTSVRRHRAHCSSAPCSASNVNQDDGVPGGWLQCMIRLYLRIVLIRLPFILSIANC